ncbi:MAG: HEAT repeat domain-containing protein [Planctomycetaceae bacterium]
MHRMNPLGYDVSQRVSWFQRLIATSLATLSLLGVSTSVMHADVIRLKNGGQIRGEVESQDNGGRADGVTINTLTGARVTIPGDDVDFISPRSLRIEEYETQARTIPDTVDAHWKLAEWAREQHLKQQRDEQLDHIIRLEPDHEEAQRGLGRSLHNGRWMTRDELMTSRGYIRHRGKYITQQELDLIERTDAQRQAEQVWHGKVRLWFGWATGRDAERQADGRQKLSQITDPDAIAALVKVMADSQDRDVRLFLVKLLTNIPDSRSVGPLVQQSLLDVDGQVREAAIKAIDEPRRPPAINLYIAALENKARIVVRRAGYALGQIGDRSAIPALIAALVTQHQYQVTYQEATPTYALSSDGNIGFAGTTSGLTPEVEGLMRTGQLPYGAVVIPPPGGTVTKSTTVTRTERNVEVLEALKTLSGENFGFDERTWQLWWAAHENGTGWNSK